MTTTTTATTTVSLPGAGRPPVTIGDENTPEQFLLGQLYYQALKAAGFSVTLNQSIGPTEVIMQALANGQLAMYPEYLDAWDTTVAGIQHTYRSRRDAYLAGQHYALKHGLALLNMTPFSNTNAIAVAFDYAVENAVQSIPDLLKVAPQLTLGGPPQFQQSPDGLPRSRRPTAWSHRRSNRSNSALNTRRSTRGPSRRRSSRRPIRSYSAGATRCCATPRTCSAGAMSCRWRPSGRSTPKARCSRPRSTGSARCSRCRRCAS